MIPAKQNKIDISKLTEEEQKAFRMYGKLPTGKDLLAHKFKERRYFDSGDYAMQKAGKSVAVGSEHPAPDTIPHSNSSTQSANLSTSPAKETPLHEAQQ